MHHLEDTKDNRSLWWTQRNSLDQRLSTFLSNLEDFWFGPWKFLLWGEFSGCKQQEAALRKLVHNLKVKCNVDAQEGLFKVILGGAKHVRGSEECILQLILVKECFIGYGNQKRLGASSDTGHEVESVSKSAFKLTLEALHEVDKGDFLNREPVILVLDFDVQMLPWESLPIVRNQEVYRMPSIGSIFATLDRCCQFQVHDARNAGIFPLIDPLDAFYLSNPSGDLSSRQDKFEDFFSGEKLGGNSVGKAGTAPTIEELAVALSSHDLCIYFGHGSGLQFIPEQEIQKLQIVPLPLLMGCSSGSLSLNGSYNPQGAPLCYLSAGSPVIVANLWEVTAKDID
ncbi:hypothetical protein Vadar_006956 [Vaccinium darrowii]|uniref:Uncharacterized protein n=1 Tax=Vaccinium darrowii TaxID=229202 RepID=A0ACB7WYL6_9ERIC|nr:hypothetical protein Vadar_006956 [Vaccinium darrowii]